MYTFACNVVSAYTGKWFNPKMLKVYIQPEHKYTVMMKHGFAEWDRLTSGNVRFKYVSSPNTAQIKVYFVKKIDTQNKQSLDRAIGLTRYSYLGNNKKFTRATIYIAEKTQEGKNLNRDEVYTVMLHEIGHAIGLDHSNDPESVMYPSENVIQEISKADLRTLKKLYNWN